MLVCDGRQDGRGDVEVEAQRARERLLERGFALGDPIHGTAGPWGVGHRSRACGEESRA